MAKQTYFKYTYELPESFQDVEDSYDYVQVLHNKNPESKKRLMIVVDHVPREDLKSGMLLNGYTGDTLKRMSRLCKDIYKSKENLDSLDWFAINFNLFRTYNKSDDFKRSAHEVFSDRLYSAIMRYKPDTILTFGSDSFKALNAAKLRLAKNHDEHFFGTAIPTKLKYKGETHKFKHVPAIPLNLLLDQKSIGENSYLLGYCMRNMVTAFEGKMRYKIPQLLKNGEPYEWEDGKLSYESVIIDTVPKVKKLLKRMAKAKYTSIDTESENLNRRVNKILTFQITDDPRKAYIIPIYHKDTPFTAKELKKISKLIRSYFEVDNNNKYQIFVNAKFDLNLMRGQFGIRYYKSDVWDVQAGEFALDENMKILATVVNGGYYNLGNLTMQYGNYAYLKSKFGKENRATITNTDLDQPLIDYCSLDIVIPMYIFKYQLQRAKVLGYENYEQIVGNQISDQIQSFSVLESTGAKADIEYLFKLKLPNSPINSELKKAEEKLFTSKAVQQANKILAADNNIPTNGLFGKVVAKVFNLRKSEHKQVLFFDVLGLKPVEQGKKLRPNGSPEGSIGKSFQDAYEDKVQEVSWFKNITKIKKLRDAFVHSLIKHWGKDDDFRSDKRIRPQYSYLKVVTGRTSASDPNLQQIPSRSELGKHIKRLFIAGKGKLLIKVDYSAHEVRCWSIISGDQEVAGVFDVGTEFRNRFKVVPDPYIAKRIELDGDVHKINAAYFFGLDIWGVTKPIRNSVKTVIFGLIYQQSLKNLAKQIGRELKVVEEIVAKFLKRFPLGVKWFDLAKDFAKKNYYVQSPLGRRRNLWGLILPKSVPERESVSARCLRQAVNSPVQGFGSDLMMIGIRSIDRLKFEHFLKTGHYPDMALSVSVHDSVTVEVAYEDFWIALDFIDRGLTSEVVSQVEKRYPGFKFTSKPEVDFEIGPNERDVKEWDFSYGSLEKIIKGTLDFQKKEMGYKMNRKKVYNTIMKNQYEHMPEWMKKQVHALGIEMDDLGDDIRSKAERKNCKAWLKEIKPNSKKLEKLNADIEHAKQLEEKKAA